MTMKTFCDIVKLFDFSDLITFYNYIILNTILIGITKYRIVIDEMDRCVNSQVSLQHNKQLPYFSAISRFSASGLFTSSGFGSPPLSPPPGMGGLSLINQARGRVVTCYCAVCYLLCIRSNWSLGCTRTKTRRNLISRNRSMLLCCTWRWYSQVVGGGADQAGVAGDAAQGGGRVHPQGERRHQPDPREEGDSLQIRRPSTSHSLLISRSTFPCFCHCTLLISTIIYLYL